MLISYIRMWNTPAAMWITCVARFLNLCYGGDENECAAHGQP